MYEPQKLHPIAYLGSVIKGIKTMFFPAILLIFNMREELVSGSVSLWMILSGGGILLLIFILFTGFDILNKLRTRFWIEDDKFVYKDGILTRKEKDLDIKRIQSIDFNEPFFHRLFGAVQLDVLTPGDGIKIDTIKKSQATDIQQAIYHAKDNEEIEVGSASPWPRTDATEAESRVFVTIKKMSFKELLLMAMTSGGLGVFAAIFFGILNIIGGEIIIENYLTYFENLLRSVVFAIVVASLIFVVIGYIIGTAIILIKNYDYTLKRRGDDLLVDFGLFSKKSKSVNINRVQNVIISDSVIRRLIGYYSLSVSITSDSLESEQVDGRVKLLPFIKKKELYDILADIFPNYNIDMPKRVVPMRSYRRYIQLSILFMVVVTSILAYFFHGETFMFYIYIAAALILLLMIVSGIYSAKNVGYTIVNDEINMMEVSAFTRRHYAIKHDKIINTTYRRNPFLHRANLGHIEVSTAGGIGESAAQLKFLEEEDIEKIWTYIERGNENDEDLTTSHKIVENQSAD